MASAIFPKTRVASWTSFGGYGGLIRVNGVANVTFDHLVIDGNRSNRTLLSSLCTGTDTPFAQNTNFLKSPNVKIFYSVFRNALCSSGLIVDSTDAVISHNVFSGNGHQGSTDATHPIYADGLTVTGGYRATVMDNQFIDNTDVNLIIAKAYQANVQFNTISMTSSPTVGNTAGAALMLDNFNSSELIDSQQSDFSYNTIDCGQGMCGFGIQIGGRNWYGNQAPIVLGGSFHHNSVRGVRQGINVSGAGSTAAPVSIQKNTISIFKTYASGCGWDTNLFNISPDSIVTADIAPASTYPWNNACTIDMTAQ
jgi:hypothetical protein